MPSKTQLRITEADVNLDVESSMSETRQHDSPQAAISIVFPDRVHFQRVHIKDQAIVVNLGRCDLSDGAVDTGFGGLSHAEQIEVPGGPILFPDPDREQHGTLQDELLSQR